MNINTEILQEQCVHACAESGENYLAFQMNITVHKRSDGVIESTCKFGCYTPDSGHALDRKTPADAIKDTLTACADPEKLLKLAAEMEDKARVLRMRVGGAK